MAMLLVTHEGLASALAALVGHVFGDAALARIGVVERWDSLELDLLAQRARTEGLRGIA